MFVLIIVAMLNSNNASPIHIETYFSKFTQCEAARSHITTSLSSRMIIVSTGCYQTYEIQKPSLPKGSGKLLSLYSVILTTRI